jgi:superfamily I DNA/RNA helicase
MAERTWSPQQNAVFAWFMRAAAAVALVVRARAGTGKTTTIVEAVNRFVASAFGRGRKVLVAAFNKRIQLELAGRFTSPQVEVKTLHGLGFRFVSRAWPRVTVEKRRGRRLAEQALVAMKKATPRDMVDLVADLASKGKNCLPFAEQPSELIALGERFGFLPVDEQLAKDGYTDEVLTEAALRAMVLAAQPDTAERTEIDFDDMVFVPLRANQARAWFDMVVVDEAQDMNPAQLELARRACKPNGRLIYVGDDRQAIYGFRGADGDILDRAIDDLNADELPLTVTYRCAQKIVAAAQQLVPDYEGVPEAGDGVVRDVGFEHLVAQAQEGDFVLSRKNAPLARICLRFLAAGKRAKIEGRGDIGPQLLATIRKMPGASLTARLEALGAYTEAEVAKALLKEDESRAETLRDTYDTLHALSDGLATLAELEARIEALFAEAEDDGVARRVVLSSVHKAKGLEADRVFVLADTLYPGKGGRARPEEANIHYVAITRAKRELVMVRGLP